MPGLTPNPGSRSGSTVYLDELGHAYAIRREHGRTRYMYCKTFGCGAHGRDELGQLALTVPHAAFCRPNPQLHQLNRMREMRQLARTTGRCEPSFRAIEAQEEFRGVAGLIRLPAFASSLRRAVNQGRPAIPHSVEEFAALLPQHARYSTNKDGDPFFVGTVRNGERVHLIFVSDRILRAIEDRGQAVRLHADAAVKTVPGLFKQLFAVQAVGGNHVYGCVYVLMTGKEQGDYAAVLGFIMERYPRLVVESWMMDHERALRNAARHSTPNARLYACRSHYARRIKDRFLKGSLPSIRDTAEGHQLYRMCITLPLLPADLTVRGLNEVVVPAGQRLQLTPRQRDDLQVFLRRYMDGYWMRRVGPEVLSVAGLDRRTNNDGECWNGYVTGRAVTHRDNVWSCTETISEVESRDRNDFMRWWVHRVPPRRPRPGAMDAKDARIARNCSKTLEIIM
ncbi:hypothetical protein ONE63_011580 [Megalurothrips usitatus]|uniref:MULE transposase domain-containing protein n=1 Tax=Megalurothrips usitatus TaxID=439358 RepID=A0AAV7X5B2_9NEOP|nr:hypothetical protein ONE63_011580 [Megalurothrips usitatus]